MKDVIFLAGNTILIWHENDCERLMAKTIKATENLFESFGVSSATARNLQIRSSLMIELEKFIRSRSMTQVEAAKYFGSRIGSSRCKCGRTIDSGGRSRSLFKVFCRYFSWLVKRSTRKTS